MYARNRDLNYEIKYFMDLQITELEYGKESSGAVSWTIEKLELATLPVMVRSVNCSLTEHTKKDIV